VYAELKRLHSPDVSLNTYLPEEPGYFGILIQAFIGPKNLEGEESFDFVMCSPRWFADQVTSDNYMWGRYYLFVSEYNADFARKAVEKLCSSVEGETWQIIAQSLAQYMKWEFEGYEA
jgi:hypothetical protein